MLLSLPLFQLAAGSTAAAAPDMCVAASSKDSISVSAGSALVVGQLLLLYAKPAAELRGAVGVGWGIDEALPMRDAAAVDAGIGARSCKPLEGVVLLCQLRLLLTHAADAAAAAADDCGLHTGRGGWEMISQRGLAAACAAATALAPGVARAGAAERRRPYKDDTLPLLLPLLLTLEAIRAVGDASADAGAILLLLKAARFWPCFICLYCRAAATARLLLLLVLTAEGCGPACSPARPKGCMLAICASRVRRAGCAESPQAVSGTSAGSGAEWMGCMADLWGRLRRLSAGLNNWHTRIADRVAGQKESMLSMYGCARLAVACVVVLQALDELSKRYCSNSSKPGACTSLGQKICLNQRSVRLGLVN